MNTNERIVLTFRSENEQIVFDGDHQPDPIVEFLPWPIKVPGIIFPDGTEQETAGAAIPQTPWLSNIDGAGNSLYNAFDLWCTHEVRIDPGSNPVGYLTLRGYYQARFEIGATSIASWFFSANPDGSLGCSGPGVFTISAPLSVYNDINIVDSSNVGYAYRINGVPFGMPAGSTGQVQFNNNGAFGADSRLNWDINYASMGVNSPANPDVALTVGGNLVVSSYSGNDAIDGFHLWYSTYSYLRSGSIYTAVKPLLIDASIFGFNTQGSTQAPYPIGGAETHIVVGNALYTAWLDLCGQYGVETTAVMGGVTFSNMALSATDNRVAIISGGSDGVMNSGYLSFVTANAGVMTERMRITATGFVGINQPTPAYPLDVAGLANDTNAICSIGGSGGGVEGGIQFGFRQSWPYDPWIQGVSTQGTLWMQTQSGGVYIGPQSTTVNYLSQGLAVTVTGSGPQRAATFLSDTGIPQVSIGWYQPRAMLDVNGDVLMIGPITIGSSGFPSQVTIYGLPSTDPGGGSQQLWYDPADGNRVKYSP